MMDPAEFQKTVLRALADILPIAMAVLFQAQERANQGNVDAEIHALEEHCKVINCYLKTLDRNADRKTRAGKDGIEGENRVKNIGS